MSTFDPIPHLRAANDAQQARSAETLAILSGVPIPEWTQHTPPVDSEAEATEEEVLEWLTEQN